MLQLSPRARGTRSLVAGLLGLGALLMLPSLGCSEPLSEAECEQLLDRYVELLAVSYESDVSHITIARYQERARDIAARDPHFADCSARVSRRAFECAMDAPNADRLEICLM